MNSTITLDVRGVPELVWGVRHLVAEALRDAAQDETSPVAARLREIVARFETVGGVDVVTRLEAVQVRIEQARADPRMANELLECALGDLRVLALLLSEAR